MKPQKIYIAGPISNDDPSLMEFNVKTAMQAALNVYRRGHYPFCPHLNYYMHNFLLQEFGESLEYEQWMDWDNVWVTACDALLYLGPSKGADRELSQALREGKTIYYSVAEIPHVADVYATKP